MPWGTMVTPNQQELNFWDAHSSAVSAIVHRLTAIVSLHSEMSGKTVHSAERLPFTPAPNNDGQELRVEARAQRYSTGSACSKDPDSVPSSAKT